MFPTDTDNAPQSADLNPAVDLAAYHALIAERIPIIMVSTGQYPNLDPMNPAALSHHIVTDLLRRQLGFQGAVMTDDLQRPTGHSPSEAAVFAALAGADIVFACSDPSGGEVAYSGLLQAAQTGRIPRAVIETANAQIRGLKAQYATG